jgi:multiple sugar transport system permease protein
MRRSLLFLFPFLLFCCSSNGADSEKPKRPIKLVVWGMVQSEESKGLDAVVKEFEKRHGWIKVELLSMGAGGMNPQKLMTSIAGGVPPDVIHQDRFTIGDWASRDAFMPLDDFIKRDGINPSDFYPACWNEAVYKGKVYAIPYGTDDRALYWNKKLFREVGLDPERPPRTWDELVEYAERLTEYNPDGSFKRIGFIPNFGNSWLYLYGWQNGGEFMSPDGRRCTLNDPRIVGALEWMVSVYDKFKGVDAINAFSSTFQTNELDPFLTGKVAMKIDGNWVLSTIARYATNLDFGVAPAPVPRERYEGKGIFAGKPRFITWSGGFSLAIPRGARHVEEAWEFIKFMTSVEGYLISNEAQMRFNMSRGKPFVPGMSANIRADEAVFAKFAPKDQKFRKALRTFMDLMKVSRFRPVTFVGQKLWDEHVRAFDLAVHHKMSPKEALDRGTKEVQKELDSVFGKERDPILRWRYPVTIILLLVAIGTSYLFLKYGMKLRISRLMMGEAFSGFLFALPWIVGFVLFTAGPMLASLVFSFCSYDVLHPPRFVGLRNYVELLRDPIFWKSLWNAAYLSIFGIPMGMAVSLSIALLLNSKVKGMSIYRTIYYVPAIVPVIANAILWVWILNPEFGLVNTLFRITLGKWFGIEAPKWLASESWSKPSLILMGMWGAGASMILWLAGLQGIPQHLYEAAEIDGASWWQKFRYITIPQLTPYIFFNMIMGTIGSLQTFESVYVMTGGGPVDSTMVPVLYLFNNAFAYFKMGYASAMAWFIFVLILAMTMVQIRLAPRWVHYEGLRR